MSDRLQEAVSGQSRGKGFGGWIGGRANRKEYWIWVAPLFAIAVILEVVGIPGGGLATGLPMLFIWIRRLHDLGRSGWWAPAINVVTNVTSLLGLAFPSLAASAMVGGLFYIAALVALGSLRGQPAANAYGPPTGRPADIAETFS